MNTTDPNMPKLARRRTKTALEQLYLMISAGFEFPDACSRAARANRIDYDRLKNAYDAAEAEGSRREYGTSSFKL